MGRSQTENDSRCFKLQVIAVFSAYEYDLQAELILDCGSDDDILLYIQVELLREQQMCIHICSVMISQTTVTCSLHHLYITEKMEPTKNRHEYIYQHDLVSQKKVLRSII